MDYAGLFKSDDAQVFVKRLEWKDRGPLPACKRVEQNQSEVDNDVSSCGT
jgi:hypothetical protein